MTDDIEESLSKKVKKSGHKHVDYFDLFECISECSVREAALLVEIVENFVSAEDVKKRIPEAHSIENEADAYVREAIAAANSDFLPPIDREDIVELAMALDEVCDQIEKVIKHMYMYNITSMEPEAIQMSKLIEEQCSITYSAMKYFRDFRKPKKLRARSSEIDAIEGQIDDLYMDTIHELFVEGGTPDKFVKWRLVYSTMESCSDVIEHAADLMVRVVVKNG